LPPGICSVPLASWSNNSSATVQATGSGSITLNSRYILDALQVMNGKEIKIAFNGKVEPVLLTDQTKEEYLHIIMPLKS
jgi:DNA polymerase III sliding clamp (beta) subunit (PCNA family)